MSTLAAASKTQTTAHVVSHASTATIAIYFPELLLVGEQAIYVYERESSTLTIQTFSKENAPSDAFKIRQPNPSNKSGLSTKPYITFSQERHFGFKLADGLAFDAICSVIKTAGGMKITLKIPKPTEDKRKQLAFKLDEPVAAPTPTASNVLTVQDVKALAELCNMGFTLVEAKVLDAGGNEHTVRIR